MSLITPQQLQAPVIDYRQIRSAPAGDTRITTPVIDLLRNTTGVYAIWGQIEQSGNTIVDYSVNGLHGTNTGAEVGQPGCGDGSTSYLYDGVFDYGDLRTPGITPYFNQRAGTLGSFFKVAPGALTDGILRRIIRCSNGTYTLILAKSATNNQLTGNYAVNGVSKGVTFAFTSTAWNFYSITWDVGAGATGEYKAYLNGVQQGSTQTGLSVWDVPITSASLGAANPTTPANVWSGWLQYTFAANRALTLTEVQAISRLLP